MEEQAIVRFSEVHGLTLFLTRCVPLTRSNWAYSSTRESRNPAGKPTFSTHAMGSFSGIRARVCSSRVACFPGQCLGTLSFEYSHQSGVPAAPPGLQKSKFGAKVGLVLPQSF